MLGPAGQAVLVALGFALFYVVLLVAFGHMRRRHCVFTHGLRGTGVLVDVRGARPLERRSVVERPTVRVVVATAAVPSGVLTDQKLPAGEYHRGQVVPVVQHPTDPRRLYVDRPDLERSSLGVQGMGAMLVLAPIVALLGISDLLRGACQGPHVRRGRWAASRTWRARRRPGCARDADFRPRRAFVGTLDGVHGMTARVPASRRPGGRRPNEEVSAVRRRSLVPLGCGALILLAACSGSSDGPAEPAASGGVHAPTAVSDAAPVTPEGRRVELGDVGSVVVPSTATVEQRQTGTPAEQLVVVFDDPTRSAVEITWAADDPVGVDESSWAMEQAARANPAISDYERARVTWPGSPESVLATWTEEMPGDDAAQVEGVRLTVKDEQGGSVAIVGFAPTLAGSDAESVVLSLDLG